MGDLVNVRFSAPSEVEAAILGRLGSYQAAADLARILAFCLERRAYLNKQDRQTAQTIAMDLREFAHTLEANEDSGRTLAPFELLAETWLLQRDGLAKHLWGAIARLDELTDDDDDEPDWLDRLYETDDD